MKLTKAQRELLNLCVSDERGMVGVASHYAPAKILVRKGMATWRDNDRDSERLVITPAGRAALESQQ
jgi:hypothetical protein